MDNILKKLPLYKYYGKPDTTRFAKETAHYFEIITKDTIHTPNDEHYYLRTISPDADYYKYISITRSSHLVRRVGSLNPQRITDNEEYYISRMWPIFSHYITEDNLKELQQKCHNQLLEGFHKIEINN